MLLPVIVGIDTLGVEQRRRDIFGGMGFFGGQPPSPDSEADGRARVLNVPSRIDITILEPITHVVVARTWSKPDGTWRVSYLNPTMQFMVVGTDRSRRVNSAIQDWVYPDPLDI